jgi:hypothetical protein
MTVKRKHDSTNTLRDAKHLEEVAIFVSEIVGS